MKARVIQLTTIKQCTTGSPARAKHLITIQYNMIKDKKQTIKNKSNEFVTKRKLTNIIVKSLLTLGLAEIYCIYSKYNIGTLI